MNELIKVNYENSDRPTVLGRELHSVLEVKTPYKKWFDRMCEYGFTENSDFVSVDKNVFRSDGTEMPQMQYDHQRTINMAKELCMIQRTEKGKQCRQYFIKIEEEWNNPDAVMARALKMADRKLLEAQSRINNLTLTVNKQNELLDRAKPLVCFANSVKVSENSILVGSLAKILKQNGIDIGQKRLFEWLRNNGYLIKSGGEYNLPTQHSMELGLFEIKETPIHNNDKVITKFTTKVTGKGQLYFVNKFIGKKEEVS